jgi:osmotically-inducible protein OsmY
MRRISFALSVAAAGLMLGAASPGALADEGSTDADDQERQIRANLEKAPDLKNNRIEVDVDDGIAVLEGTVDSRREKKEATNLAHVDGILGVNNRLHVRGAGK